MKKEKQAESIKRLNKISGQIDGIKKMIESDRYCVDILNQIAAVRAALGSTGKFILENHLKTCVSSAIMKGAADSKIREIVELFGKYDK